MLHIWRITLCMRISILKKIGALQVGENRAINLKLTLDYISQAIGQFLSVPLMELVGIFCSNI